ncbi:11-beta-hydroxysteroid dehydrogenase [Bertholletia excelsa]
MDSIQSLISIVIPLITLVAIPAVLPALLLYRIVRSILGSKFDDKVAGKVVLITGASSGIGEHLAYEYARTEARLVLVARRREQLQAVAQRARQLGSPEVIIEIADVSKVEDCKKCVEAAVNHFGRLDHLVNNAGMATICKFEDYTNVDDIATDMNVNFWGAIYCTHFAIPHLRKSKGKIIVTSSAFGWFPAPRLSIHGASKAALITLYETLRVEFGADIGVTIVTPGLIESEMTKGKFLTKDKLISVLKCKWCLVEMSIIPVVTAERCAKAVVNGACSGEKYQTEPSWIKMTLF